MSTVIRLSVHSAKDAKVVPMEVLRDFADVTSGWSYLKEDSEHYSDLKDAPGLVLRHRADRSTYVDLGFVETAPDTLRLAVLDRPGADEPLTPDSRAELVDTFLDATRNYLSDRPDAITLEVERDATSS